LLFSIIVIIIKTPFNEPEMDLQIMGLVGAVMYKPIKPTYAIRIQSGIMRYDEPLKKSSFYTMKEYTFDDDNPRSWGKMGATSITFNEDIAQRILNDFVQEGRTREVLLVHCSRGINRSPAVGIALNEIFTLGSDSEELKRQYPETNWYIYETLIETAQKLKIHP